MQYFNSLCCYLHLLTLLFSFGIFSGIFIPVKERFEIEFPNSSLKNKQYYILFIYIIKDRVQNKTRTRPTINKNKNVQVGKKNIIKTYYRCNATDIHWDRITGNCNSGCYAMLPCSQSGKMCCTWPCLFISLSNGRLGMQTLVQCQTCYQL